jgi:sec-independent protein translocase protein TatA
MSLVGSAGTSVVGATSIPLLLTSATIAAMIVAEIFGPDALIVVVLAVVLLFGADRLPRLARSLGEASRELKHGQGKTEAGKRH